LVVQLKKAIRASVAGGRSLRDISRASGVRPEQLSRFLRGERDLTLTTAGMLLETLGLELVSKPAPEQPRGRPRKEK
jgi:DNA-binding phage protein